MKFFLAHLFLFILLATLSADVDNSRYLDLLNRIEIIESEILELKEFKEKISDNHEGFYEEIADHIQEKKEETNYPWMDIAKWDNLNLEMSPDQVIEILGKPTKYNESLNKRIDFVFIYKRVLSDSKIEGFVRFRKGLVVEIEKPKI